MAGTRKEFAGAAAAADLQTNLTDAGLTVTLGSGQGSSYPDGATGDFTIDVDEGLSSAERMLCESRTGDVITVKAGGRGFDGTTAQAHTAGSGKVTHGFDADSADEFMDHVYDTTRDDHTQYVNVDGSNPLTGDLDLDGNKIVSFGDGSAAAPAIAFDADPDTGIYTGAANHVAFTTGGVLAGFFNTAQFQTQLPIVVDGAGNVISNQSGSAAAPSYTFTGDTDTGIYRSGADTGVLTAGGTAVVFWARSASINYFSPWTDDSMDCGSGSNRWDDVYATNTTIQTSDANEKDDIGDTPLGLDFIKALRPVRYRYKKGSRPHDGFTVQQIRQALAAVGVDDAAMVVDPKVGAGGRPKKGDFKAEKVERDPDESDEDFKARKQQAKDDAEADHAQAVEDWEGRMAAPLGLRVGEMVGPLVKAVQEQQAQIDALTARLDKLEGKK